MSNLFGYTNDKAQGKTRYATLHGVGSGKTAQNTISKGAVERTASPQTIVSVTARVDRNKHPEFIVEITGHGAKVGDVLRFDTGPAAEHELDIIEVIDANNVVVQAVAGVTPAATNTATVLYFKSARIDDTGSVVVNTGPVQFLQDGSPVDVEEDTAVPANTIPLPVAQKFAPLGYASLSLSGVDDGAYTELMASVGATKVKKVQVFMDSGTPLLLCFGAAASEVAKFIIMPGGSGVVDIDIPAGTRLSVTLAAAGAALSSGTLYINLLG
jgi:hypothetical protein